MEQVCESLARAGVEAAPAAEGVVSGPGVLIVDSPEGARELVRELSRGGRNQVIAVVGDRGVLVDDRSWSLLECGAADVLWWGRAAVPGEEIAERLRRWAEVDRLLESRLVRRGLAGDSETWRSVMRQVVEAAHFTTAPLLVTGETGTGKEQVAHLVHELDGRPDKRDLVVLDCGSVVPSLSGSEFFGHERGAFTGAIARREGAFELADGGTLFLDEIGELPLSLQAELLRVVQEGADKRVGSSTWQTTNFRLVCATNRDLLEQQANGGFRRDLYYRIAGWSCRLPSLRERPEDILPLAHHFVAELRGAERAPQLDEPVERFLLARDYPGNVRDLRHLVARMCFRHVGPGPITLGAIPPDERPREQLAAAWPDDSFRRSVRAALARGLGLREVADAAADAATAIAVAEADGNLRRASARLGVTTRALQLRRRRSRAELAPGQGG